MYIINVFAALCLLLPLAAAGISLFGHEASSEHALLSALTKSKEDADHDGSPGVPHRDYVVSLPHSDSVLSERLQWWYWTGHLADANNSSKTFGFELCFFLVDGFTQLVHVALTDVSNDAFHFAESVRINVPPKTEGSFSLTTDIASASGGDGTDALRFSVGEYELFLSLDSGANSPTVHYSGRRHEYSFGGYTLYYSRTKMSTTGTLLHSPTNSSAALVGNSWFDRQYGDLFVAVLQGWMWFAIELSDGRDVMLFDFLKDDTEKSGSVTGPDGVVAELAGGDFEILVLDDWTSDKTGCTYPSEWSVKLAGGSEGGGESFLLRPVVKDQELDVHFTPKYWEGKVDVFDITGKEKVGEAYVELNGFCTLF